MILSLEVILDRILLPEVFLKSKKLKGCIPAINLSWLDLPPILIQYGESRPKKAATSPDGGSPGPDTKIPAEDDEVGFIKRVLDFHGRGKAIVFELKEDAYSVVTRPIPRTKAPKKVKKPLPIPTGIYENPPKYRENDEESEKHEIVDLLLHEPDDCTFDLRVSLLAVRKDDPTSAFVVCTNVLHCQELVRMAALNCLAAALNEHIAVENEALDWSISFKPEGVQAFQPHAMNLRNKCLRGDSVAASLHLRFVPAHVGGDTVAPDITGQTSIQADPRAANTAGNQNATNALQTPNATADTRIEEGPPSPVDSVQCISEQQRDEEKTKGKRMKQPEKQVLKVRNITNSAIATKKGGQTRLTGGSPLDPGMSVYSNVQSNTSHGSKHSSNGQRRDVVPVMKNIAVGPSGVESATQTEEYVDPYEKRYLGHLPLDCTSMIRADESTVRNAYSTFIKDTTCNSPGKAKPKKRNPKFKQGLNVRHSPLNMRQSPLHIESPNVFRQSPTLRERADANRMQPCLSAQTENRERSPTEDESRPVYNPAHSVESPDWRKTDLYLPGAVEYIPVKRDSELELEKNTWVYGGKEVKI